MTVKKIVLFGLTGLGNSVLRTLIKNKYEISLLVTRKEEGSFPYYCEENIIKLARREKVPFSFLEPVALQTRIKKIKPDLILSATYHRIIPASLCSLAKYAVNIHPSLLPKYKGPMPDFYALVNKEKATGLSAHFLVKQVDSGDIILQKKIPITRREDICSLKRKLARFSGIFILELIKKLESDDLKPVRQKIKKSDFYPRFPLE